MMRELGIPTPDHRIIHDPHDARACLADWDPPYVIKADGLAGGKGVVIERRPERALMVMKAFLAGQHGASPSRLLLERHVKGTELSLQVLCDGSRAQALGSARDYKRARDGGKGPNTGGMGACSPSPLELDGKVDTDKLVARFVTPLLHALAKRGHGYRGFLYPGLIVSDDTGEALCLEYNCRLGDPETQVLAPRWEGGVAEALLAAANGRLQDGMIGLSGSFTVGVVVASAGYPSPACLDEPVFLPASTGSDLLFHAATTRMMDGSLRSAGGRVACCVSIRDDHEKARAAAYRLIRQVSMRGARWRNDIGN